MGKATRAPKKSRRTMLFSPANNPKMLAMAHLYGSDCVIFDLEDAIKYAEKDAARDLFAEALKTIDYGDTEIYARLNPLYTEFGEKDVRVLVPAGLRYMRLAMTDTPEQIKELDALLTEVEKEHGIEIGSCKIQASLETPTAVNNAYEIATASERVVTMSFGAEDFTRTLGAERTKEGKEIFVAKSMIVMAAARAGIDAIDTVWAFLDDIEGFKKEIQNSVNMGFAGKSCVHPSQIKEIHSIFTPSKKEIEKSLIIVKAAEEADIENGGVIQVNGKMIDIPIISKAQKVVNLAKAAGVIK